MKEKRFSLFYNDAALSLFSSLLSILIGLLVGSVIMVIVALCSSDLSMQSAADGVQLIFGGMFSTGRNELGALSFGFNPAIVGNVLFRATPLIMVGLSVAVAFQAGLFNIGAPGQYLISTAVTLMIALSIPSDQVAPWLIWLLAFLGGCLSAGLWGAFSGAVKAFLNINEVLACIMTNWIAANLVTAIFDGSHFCNSAEYGKLGYIYKTTYNNVSTSKLGLDRLFPNSQVNAGILIAIAAAIIMYVLMNRTTLGYQLQACGSNRHAARYAGIQDKRNIVLSMALAGALAGGSASLYYLSGNTEFFWSTYQSLPSVGFNGIPVALLAVSNPIGVIFAGLFMSILDTSGLQLTKLTAYNEYITDVIVAVIVLLSAFSPAIKSVLKRFGSMRRRSTPTAGEEASKQ